VSKFRHERDKKLPENWHVCQKFGGARQAHSAVLETNNAHLRGAVISVMAQEHCGRRPGKNRDGFSALSKGRHGSCRAVFPHRSRIFSVA
jgi:hypothetical protein